MTAWADTAAWRILAEGGAETTGLAISGSRRTSFYADPVAWLMVDAIEAALKSAAERVQVVRAETGVLAMSDYATRQTMRAIAAQASQGRVSPLRFAGASPGSLAGLPCIVLGFRGPSLLLCMRPEAAREAAEPIVLGWLATGQCRYVAVVEHTVTGAVHVARGRILQRREPVGGL